MKIFYTCSIFLFLLLTIYSCTEKSSDKEEKEEIQPIIFQEILIVNDNCLPDSLTCTHVKIEYPEYTDSVNYIINDMIQAKLKSISSSYFREEALAGTFEYMANLFIKDYNEFKLDFPDYKIGWYVRIKAAITYESNQVLSFQIDAESFTGGAHPNSSSSMFVINKSTAQEMTITDIVRDTIKFKSLLEKEFRSQKGIEDNQSFADKGFYIEDGDFYLNDNIGMTDQYISVHFNPYEIAPYSMGATTINLKKEELKDILKVE